MERDRQEASLGGESGFDSFSDFGRIGRRAWLEAFDNFAIPADQELAEIPFDVTGEWGFLSGESDIKRMTFRTVDVDFVEERKSDAVFLGAELLDLLIVAGFLATELVTRKSEHGESFGFVFFVHGFERFVLGSQTPRSRARKIQSQRIR